MNLTLAYRDRSAIVRNAAGLAVSLAPNLRRDRVGYDGLLRHPLRFREAIGALHDVVIGDLRYTSRGTDRPYDAYNCSPRRPARPRSAGASPPRRGGRLIEATPALAGPDFARLDRDFRHQRGRYWNARRRYSDHLRANDPGLWRLLVPCDPILTVAPDVLFFECFGADESSYACLTVDRGRLRRRGRRRASGRPTSITPGPSAINSSSCRSYRQTRFRIDPGGFEVATSEGSGPGAGYREEEIELPTGWLRGFSQIQAAMSLPDASGPPGPRGALRSVLTFLARNKAAHRPPGRPVRAGARPAGDRRPGALGTSGSRFTAGPLRRARRPRPSGPGAATDSGSSPGFCRWSTRSTSTSSGTGLPELLVGQDGGDAALARASPAGPRTTGRAARPWPSSPRRPSRAGIWRSRSPGRSGSIRRRPWPRSPGSIGRVRARGPRLPRSSSPGSAR